MVALPTDPPMSYGTENTSTYEVSKTEFGDGYTAREAPGLNSIRQKWTLYWKGITTAQKEILRDFFRARAGVEAIEWTPFGQATELKFTCESFRDRPVGFDSWDCRANFEQVFDP